MTNDIEHARAVRLRKAAIMRALGDGSLSVKATLRAPPNEVKKCTVFDLIAGSRGMGPTGTERALNEARVSPVKRVGNLTTTEVKAIIHKLPKRAR